MKTSSFATSSRTTLRSVCVIADVGDQAPVRLADRELRVGRDEADVGAERDLEARAVRHAVHRCDHRHRHLLPDPGRALGGVGGAVVAAIGEARPVGALAEAPHHRLHVEPGGEGAALAREHDRAQRAVARELEAGLGERREHRQVHRVQLVRAHHAHVGDAVLLLDPDPLFHRFSFAVGNWTRAVPSYPGPPTKETTMKLGTSAVGFGPKVSIDLERIRRAEALGFDSVWTAEAYGNDAVTTATWVLANTSSIKVGTAIMQMPARTPAMAAMTAMTLDQLSGGRFILGLGASGPQVVEGWHGVPYGDAADAHARVHRDPAPDLRAREAARVPRRALRRAGDGRGHDAASASR